jgi:hypothetical protein
LNVHGKLGKAIQGVVANFKEPDAKPQNFHATINWGDQSAPTPGRIRAQGKGRFSVSGSHSYAAMGAFSITVTIQDATGLQVTAHGTARVGQ